jgi:hypothetical protein
VYLGLNLILSAATTGSRVSRVIITVLVFFCFPWDYSSMLTKWCLENLEGALLYLFLLHLLHSFCSFFPYLFILSFLHLSSYFLS